MSSGANDNADIWLVLLNRELRAVGLRIVAYVH
jgi:hypothetical protein